MKHLRKISKASNRNKLNETRINTMKKIIPLLFFATAPVLVIAQEKSVAPVIKKPELVKPVQVKPIGTTTTTSTSTTTASQTSTLPPLTEGKDLTISIVRVDDISTFDLTTYKVTYMVTNSGTLDLNMTYSIAVKGEFNTLDNKFYSGGGSAAMPVSSPQFRSRETIQGTFIVNAPRLKKDVSYLFRLMIDGTNAVTEGNEYNNTADIKVTARANKSADYFLSSCKISIKTGADNKEANNSLVYFYMGPSNYNQNTFLSYGNWVAGTGYAPEIKANYTTDITLNGGGADPYNSLCFYKQKGVALTIIYNNKGWATDAWKINEISLTLYFKDRNGNAYPNPAYAARTINFNVNGLLGFKAGDDPTNNANQVRMVTIGTDQNFNPQPPEFDKLENGHFNTLILKRSPTYNTGVGYCD